MTRKILKRAMRGTMAALLAGAAIAQPAAACTRALYVGADGIVITGRSMDWMEDMQTNLWALPKGIARDGAAGPASPKWVAKYGSLVAVAYNIASADGMNEMGLVTNLLYLAESDYGGAGGRPPLSISLWGQYVLDNFATVAEAVEALSKEPFEIVTATLPNGSGAQIHLAISDPAGDSAIFEYVGGKLVIHHGKQFQILTNSPTYDQQLALETYWQQIGGTTFLPGTNRASDRFARASFFNRAIPKQTDPNFIKAVPDGTYANQAVASVLSVMRSVSVPLGMTTPGEPNIASTLWRVVADQKDKVYFFDSSTSPNAFWVPLADLDLKVGAPVKRLKMEGGIVYSGNAAARFEAATPFTFLAVPTQ